MIITAPSVVPSTECRRTVDERWRCVAAANVAGGAAAAAAFCTYFDAQRARRGRLGASRTRTGVAARSTVACACVGRDAGASRDCSEKLDVWHRQERLGRQPPRFPARTARGGRRRRHDGGRRRLAYGAGAGLVG